MADFNDMDRCGLLHSAEFGLFNALGISVGINGDHGGGSCHGDRTYICI